MNNEFILEWHSYRFLPYERRLGLREVKSLTGHEPKQTATAVVVSGITVGEPLFDRLTYFRQVRFNGTGIVVPLQAQLEATGSWKAVAPAGENEKGPLLRKQSTRYSAHGLHEYKGKFNPQIVRATANLLGIGLGGKAKLLDPFCGSGTCLVEAAHMGWDAIGVDVNPLAVFISNTKLEALKAPVATLEVSCRELGDRLRRHLSGLEFDRPFDHRTLRRLAVVKKTILPNVAYLQRWFTESVLAQLRLICAEISRIRSIDVRNIATVVLSDILRSVSLQDPADLRIRRRSDPLPNYPALELFVSLLDQRVRTILNAREVLGHIRGKQTALSGDSRKRIPPGRGGTQFDGVITSPPYATALPYLDTQRLSLALLGLLGPQELRVLERQLIGNREISKLERDGEERAIAHAAKELPRGIIDLCRLARELANQTGNGFRRRNMPALLFRYFRDMRDVFKTVAFRVKPQARFAMVVGPNRTTLSGETLLIDTPQLLASVAETVGWKVEETIPLDAYQRFNLHRQNSITTESLVVLKRKRPRRRSVS